LLASCDATLNCITTSKPCAEPNTACVTYTCNPATGGCDPTPVVCDDNNLCTIDTCDDVQGCVYTNKTCTQSSDPCEFELPCNPATGTCDKITDACDDGIDCTVDLCVSGVGCSHLPDDLQCSSSSPCVANSYCDNVTGCVVVAKDCSNGTTFCNIKFCDETFEDGCTGEPYNCFLNATNTSCAITNCSDTKGECETKDQVCFAFFGIVAGIVVAGVVWVRSLLPSSSSEL
jgi:hypothetical protein